MADNTISLPIVGVCMLGVRVLEIIIIIIIIATYIAPSGSQSALQSIMAGNSIQEHM